MTWLAILAVALVVRAGAAVWWESRLPEGKSFRFVDSESYWTLGQKLARGDDYTYYEPDFFVFRTPGYPLILAGLFKLWGDSMPVIVARGLNVIFGTASVAVIGWWTFQLFDARAARYAGWIAAIYPGGVANSVFVLSEAPFCLLMLLQLALWGVAWRSTVTARAAAWGGAAGLTAALATLIRPSWLLFTPFALVVGLVVAGRRDRTALVGAAMCACLALGMAPWWIRNARVTGRFVPTTLQVGSSLYDGLHAAADGSSNFDFYRPKIAELRAADAAAGPNASTDTIEYRLDRQLFAESLAWARENPGRAAHLAWIKFLRIWNVIPNEPSLRGWGMKLAVALTYTPLLALGLIGVWKYSRRGWPYILAWLPAVYFTALHVVFVGSIRYREPAMLALMVLVAGVLAGASAFNSASATPPTQSPGHA